MPNEMRIRVAHADVAMEMAFPNSVNHWHIQPNSEAYHEWQGDDPIPIVEIDGDCVEPLEALSGGLIHIPGCLASTIDANTHYEIVICGDANETAVINASGFCHVFVGGRFAGRLTSNDSAKIWIESDFSGTIETGHPATEVYIGGDFRGRIFPKEKASLLWLVVNGFASHESLLAITAHQYTQFNASIGRSDVPAGIYPLNGRAVIKTEGGRCSSRWCVNTTAEP